MGWHRDVIRRNKSRVELDPTRDARTCNLVRSGRVLYGVRSQVPMEPSAGR